MGSSLKRRSLASAVLASALVFFGALVLFSFATWAARETRAPATQNIDPVQAGELEFAKKLWKPFGHGRPNGLSPLEAIRPVWDVPSDKRKNMIDTALGFIDPGRIAELRLKAPLLAGAPGRRLGAGKRGEIAAGFNAIQISEAALQSRSLDDITADLKSMGVRVHDVLQSRALLVEVPQGKEEALARAGFVEAGMPWEASFRVDPRLGRTPMIQASRAASQDLDVIVEFFAGTGADDARRAIEEVAGRNSAAPFSIDGLSYETTVHYSKVPQLAKKNRVRYIYERPEFMLLNVETPTMAMVGNVKENLPFQKPYHDVGVDGGGSGALLCTNNPTRTCSINNDCPDNAQCVAAGDPKACCTGSGTGTCIAVCALQRYNNGTAAVPPQIVAVTDNGISADSVQFSHTATEVSDLLHPMPGPAHRKVHAIQNAGDNGSSCDATLSGSGTHGNVVAGIIAGDGTSVGFRVSKHTVNIRPKYENMEMDGVAKGARILLQDAAAPSACTVNEILERGGNVFPGSLLNRLTLAICPRSGGTGTCAGQVGGGNEVHLHVMPFGAPNWDLLLQNASDGTYPQAARDIDQFLVNNRDYMVFAPVGHEGTNVVQRFFTNPNGLQRNQYPDLFDGVAGNNDVHNPHPLQVSPPATAKDLISVGGHFQDFQTAFSGNLEENVLNFSSKGPATEGSLRTAPLVVGVAADGTGFFNSPNTISFAVWRSRDNDNDGPVDAILDDANFGTSFASAEVAGVAALIRDYFAQGFYPTGTRVATDRVPNVSGPLVKAAIVASANFLEFLETEYPTLNDSAVAFTRAFNIGSVGGVDVGILGNNEQGYGRPVLTSVLPLANWPAGKGIGAPNTIEYPSAGLIVFDEIATAEPAINNDRCSISRVLCTSNVQCTGGPSDVCQVRTVNEHTFTVNSDSTRSVAGVLVPVVNRGQLRIAVAWSDPPSLVDSAGALINDLDLEVESPGPDGRIDLTADNVIYDGNNYMAGGVKLGQWSQGRPFGSADVSDKRNPVEAVHLSADPNGDGNTADSQLVTGTWKVRVKRGAGGATAGQITVLTGVVEDTNGNGRLDPGEDTSNAQCVGAGNPASCCTGMGTGTCTGNGNGYLDADGQPYGLVIAGPVLGTGPQTIGGTSRTFPASTARLDKSLYGCADQVTGTIFDPGATAADVKTAATFEVVTKSGSVVDSEGGFTFTGSSPSFTSPVLPLREGKPAVSNNGILETNGNTSDEPYFVRVRYTDTPRDALASGRISCAPNLLAWRFLIENQDATQQDFIGGGCDRDQFLDAGENLTYSVTFQNSNRDQNFSDVSAALSVGGPGASAISVLNSPQTIGRLPGGQISGVTFALRVNAAAVNLLAVNNRLVDLTLTMQSTSGQVQLPRQTYTFRHALNSDYETFHYSTDYPGGGRQVRDLNRNLQIDRPDVTDPFLGIVNPDEDIFFDSMFVLGADNPLTPTVANELVSNTLGEDLNGNGCCTPPNSEPGELDLIPNGILDKGILVSSTGPTPTATGDRVPWSFDLNNGGWNGFRHPTSRPAPTTRPLTWEYVTSGVCGFQSAISDDPVDPGPTKAALFQNNGAGIWHTGDGDPTTPGTGTACDNHITVSNTNTPEGAEYIEDFLVSPIIAKVHQNPDGRGLPYSQEFQRLGFNLNIETENDVTGGNFNVDNNLDDDTGACLLCQEFDLSYGGIDYQVGTFKASGDYGFDPSQNNETRTFGPTVDPDGSTAPGAPRVDGDESGFTAFINVQGRTSPIPTAPKDLIPYPVPTAPDVHAPSDGRLWDNDKTRSDAGPVRNVDFTLVQYAGGFVYSVTGPGGPTAAVTAFDVNPGVRWEIGIGFFTVETTNTTGDYGMGIDDVVFEWDERHPVDEGQFVPPHVPACNRFLNKCKFTGVACTSNAQCTGGANDTCQTSSVQAGQQCATLSVDRTVLYECNEALTVTVNDPKRAGAGFVQVLAASDSDARQFSTGKITALHPHESFSLPEVPPGSNSGLFAGPVTISQSLNENGLLFVSDTDQSLVFYYLDPQCDGNGNGSVGQTDFNNLDGDGIAFSADNCPFDYNPAPQTDSDSDGLGNICDNCPNVANPEQRDSDGDDVGDACDLDDIDFDGVSNDLDDCPDVYDKFQVPGAQGRGVACDQNCATCDRDNDGVNDVGDNCVRTPNFSQKDSDNDGIGDACDGDCAGATPVTFTGPNPGSCSRTNSVICSTDAQCPTNTGLCQENPNKVCTTSGPQCTCLFTCSLGGNVCTTTANCTGGASDICGGETCQKLGVVVDQTCSLGGNPCTSNAQCTGGAGDTCRPTRCSTENDDLDVDGVPDAIDDCPTTVNPAIIPGTFRQADQDNDGVGDACDSPFMVDGDNNGIPDDALSFAVLVNCGRVPLPNLVILSVSVTDIVAGEVGGDGFCDAGEKCEMTLVVRNTGPLSLTDVTFFLATDDPDIQCVSRPSMVIGSLPAGTTVDTSNIGGQRRSFEYTVSASTRSTATAAAQGDFTLTLTSREALGTARKLAFRTPLDLDVPPGANPVPVPGRPAHVPPIPDGTLFEDFDTDTDGNGRVDLSDGRQGVLNDTFGYVVGTAQGGLNALAAVGCFGYIVPPADKNCSIQSDNDMDWHIHCPPGECDPVHLSPASNSSTAHMQTPPDGLMAFSGRNSLHWGRHTDNLRRLSDTTSFRSMAAYTTNPINLTPLPRPGDLQMSFYHIADMMDNSQTNQPAGSATDYGDVQVRIDRNPNPTPGIGDDWGPWDKLVPFANVYDHIPYVWSFYSNVSYCDLTPADTGSAPPAPRGVHETMCFPIGIWSHCGNAWGTGSTMSCPGPGVPGALAPPSGALWVLSEFNLANFVGARVQIRWIATGWEFDNVGPSQDYQTYGCASGTCWNDSLNDDGWWVDDIRISGAITTQIAPIPDAHPEPLVTCPTTPAARCDSSRGNDRGFNVSLTVDDANHNGFYEKGESIVLSAAATTNPGGCSDGEVQYRFLKNGAVAQEFSGAPTFTDFPTSDVTYQLLAQCTSNPACATQTGASTSLMVYPGDGTDIALSVTHDRTLGVTTLSWPPRPQPSPMSGYDVFRGSGTTGTPRDLDYGTLVQLACNVTTPVGPTFQATTSVSPATGAAHFYMVGHASPVRTCVGGPTPDKVCVISGDCGTGGTCVGARTALGRHTNGTVRLPPVAVSCP